MRVEILTQPRHSFRSGIRGQIRFTRLGLQVNQLSQLNGSAFLPGYRQPREGRMQPGKLKELSRTTLLGPPLKGVGWPLQLGQCGRLRSTFALFATACTPSDLHFFNQCKVPLMSFAGYCASDRRLDLHDRLGPNHMLVVCTFCTRLHPV